MSIFFMILSYGFVAVENYELFPMERGRLARTILLPKAHTERARGP